jgi:hypothetical protein
LLGSLARHPCPAALTAALPGSLNGSLARQPCPAGLQKSYKLLITGYRPAELQAFLTAVAGARHAALLF